MSAVEALRAIDALEARCLDAFRRLSRKDKASVVTLLDLLAN